jgi:hypothetical protein
MVSLLCPGVLNFMPRKDYTHLIGQRFGKLVITDLCRIAVTNSTPCAGVICKCDCGTNGYKCQLSTIRNGNTTSCGCKRYKSLIGFKFNRLTIVSETKIKKGKKSRTYAECLCDCGKVIQALKEAVVSGHTQSCGCVKLKFTEIEKAKAMRSSWSAMKRRCKDVDGKWFKYYGAKGINYCKRWDKFPAFYDDMQDSWAQGLELDRIENDKGYYKENCRWATHIQQQRNKTSNKLTESDVINIRKSILSPQELGEIYNVHYTTIGRIKNMKRWA